MAMSAGGYVTSPLERFVTKFNDGWTTMIKRTKEANELKIQQQNFDMAEEARKRIKDEEDRKKEADDKKLLPAADGADGAAAGSGGGSGGGSGSGATGGWDEKVARPIVDYFKSIGWSDAAIAGAMGNGLAEGGFSAPWVQSSAKSKDGKPEQSWGHWQFHRGGELDGYEKWLGDVGLDPKDPKVLQDSLNQAKYFAQRMNTIDPKFGSLTDANKAGDLVLQKFERPANAGSGIRNSQVASALQYLSNPPGAIGAATAAQVATAAPAYLPAINAPLPSEPGGSGGALGIPTRIPALAPAAAPAPQASAAPMPPGQAEYRGGLGPNVKFNSKGVPYNPDMVAGGSQGSTPSGVTIPARPSWQQSDLGATQQGAHAAATAIGAPTTVVAMAPNPANPFGPRQPVAIGGVPQQQTTPWQQNTQDQLALVPVTNDTLWTGMG